MNTIKQSDPNYEPHSDRSGKKLNWLRAAVLGANDGIVSTASLVVGVAGATSSSSAILTAGLAGLIAGALSMGVGEYISVSTQKDSEKALLEKERLELLENPNYEKEELLKIYTGKGLTQETALLVANELTLNDAYGAHVDAELGLNPNELTNPWHAAYASTTSFLAGAVVPLLIILVTPAKYKISLTFLGVFIALVITGSLSAQAGGASKRKAVIRVVSGGLLAMLVTYGIGKFFGVVGI